MARDVLVVEDDPDMAEVIVMMLGNAGYSARIAANGQEALDAVAAEKPALVLLDMLMPVMDGWQCARALHARYGHGVPIVVLTAAEHVQARAAEIDAEAALQKPFDRRELLGIVARFVSKSPPVT